MVKCWGRNKRRGWKWKETKRKEKQTNERAEYWGGPAAKHHKQAGETRVNKWWKHRHAVEDKRGEVFGRARIDSALADEKHQEQTV